MPAKLPNTQFPQFQRNIFPPQSDSANAPQPQRGVRQDKPRSPHARTASTQPAPLPKVMRPHEMNSNTARSQNRPTPQRKTVHLTLWVKPVVKAELQRRAEREGVSLSATGAAFLEKAIQANVDMQYGALLQPIIEQAIRRQMRSLSTRLAWLLVRVAFDAGQIRGVVTNILGRQPGVSPAVLKEILEGSSKTAKGNITRRTPQLAELIEVVEQWMITQEEEKQGND